MVTVLAASLLLLTACTRSESTTTSTSADAPAVSTAPAETTTTTTVEQGPGFDGTTIRVGAFLPLTGPLSTFAEQVAEGHQIYWSYVNEALGGLGGIYPVDIITVDNAYDPDQAVAQFEELAPQVAAVSASLGSLIDGEIETAAAREGVIAVAGAQTSRWVGHSSLLLNLAQATYRDQVANGLFWAANLADPALVDPTSVPALIYQSGPYGEDCAAGFDRAIAALGVASSVRLSHQPGATDFGDLVAQARGASADPLVLCTTPDAVARIVATGDLLGYRPVLLATESSFDAGVLTALGGDGGREAALALVDNLWVLGALPAPSSPGMRLFMDNVARYGDLEALDEYTFLGYVEAATVHLVLEEALRAGDLSRAGVAAAVPHVREIDMGFGMPAVGFDRSPPVSASAVGRVDATSVESPFGVTATEAYVAATWDQ